MQINKQGQMIGKGEMVTFELLTQLFPDKEIKIQVLLSSLLSDDWVADLSEKQMKETIDIVVYTTPIIAVRVQDPHHMGRITSMRDIVQKKTLEWNDIKVVDLNYYDCVTICKKEVCNEDSMKELLWALKDEGII